MSNLTLDLWGYICSIRSKKMWFSSKWQLLQSWHGYCWRILHPMVSFVSFVWLCLICNAHKMRRISKFWLPSPNAQTRNLCLSNIYAPPRGKNCIFSREIGQAWLGIWKLEVVTAIISYPQRISTRYHLALSWKTTI